LKTKQIRASACVGLKISTLRRFAEGGTVKIGAGKRAKVNCGDA
jgi:hypothetical protein